MSSTITRSPPQAQARDRRVANALRLRITDIEDEMLACCRVSAALHDEHDHLADLRAWFLRRLRTVEERLARNLNGAAAL